MPGLDRRHLIRARRPLLRLTSVTLPGGTASSYTYSYYPNSNQLQTVTDEMNEVTRRGANTSTGDTRYTLDPLNEQRRAGSQSYVATIFNRDATTGNITSVATNWYAAGTNLETDPLPAAQSTLRTVTYTYGAGGVIASLRDGNGNTTYFTYQNGTGYLTRIDAPAGAGESSRRITEIVRNADGSVQRVTDPKGQVTTYEYDGLGRLRKINYGVVNGVAAFSVSYTLDANGNLTAMSDKSGASSWTYDENNQLTSESRTQNGVTRTARYGYYANGLQSSLTTFSGQTVNFGYDQAGRLTSQTDPNDSGRTISFGYDSRSRRTSITYGSGVTERLTYDKAGRVSQVLLQTSNGTALQRFDDDYGLDASGVCQIG